MARALSIVVSVFAAAIPPLHAQSLPVEVTDIASRAGVSSRVLHVTAREPKTAALLFTGGDGGLLIADDGRIERGAGNFLVRSRERFAQAGVTVAVLGVPSDRRSPPFLSGWRQSADHAADVRALIAWLRGRTNGPVWLVGTSRGTQSVAAVALRLGAPPQGPDGVVLTPRCCAIRAARPCRRWPSIGSRCRCSSPTTAATPASSARRTPSRRWWKRSRPRRARR